MDSYIIGLLVGAIPVSIVMCGLLYARILALEKEIKITVKFLNPQSEYIVKGENNMRKDEILPNELASFKAKIKDTIEGVVSFDKVIHVDAIDMKKWSVVVGTELGAYKIAYAYRSGMVRVVPAPNVGGWLITIGY